MSAVFVLYYIIQVGKQLLAGDRNDPNQGCPITSVTFSLNQSVYLTKLVLEVCVIHVQVAASFYQTCIVFVPCITPMVSLSSMSNRFLNIMRSIKMLLWIN